MKFRFWMLIGLIFAVAIALATVVVTFTAKGEGTAKNEAGVVGKFAMNVVRVKRGDDVRRTGTFQLLVRTDAANIRVFMGRLEGLDIMPGDANPDQGVAKFEGHGVMRVATAAGAHEYAGTVKVLAVSNRHRNESGDPDGLAVDFLPAVQNVDPFHFEGRVVNGDIEVIANRSY